MADHLMLTHVRDLHRQGDLSEDEYRSIKGRLVERIDDSTRVGEKTGTYITAYGAAVIAEPTTVVRKPRSDAR